VLHWINEEIARRNVLSDPFGPIDFDAFRAGVTAFGVGGALIGESRCSAIKVTQKESNRRSNTQMRATKRSKH